LAAPPLAHLHHRPFWKAIGLGVLKVAIGQIALEAFGYANFSSPAPSVVLEGYWFGCIQSGPRPNCFKSFWLRHL
jgi:hypothetical protein